MTPNGDTQEIEVPADEQTTLCLEAVHLATLNDLASRCEDVFGGPQDIEWAFANDTLYLLQSRPITR